VLAPLRSRSYRRFWLGSLVSNLGLWMQSIALGWLVYDMTGRASWLGTVSFVGNAPTLVLGLVGGAIADRAGRQLVMMGALVLLASSAGMLALLTASGHLTLWYVIGLSMLSGIGTALYTPAMNSVVPSLVGPELLLNAISLNSVQFNLARTLGPAVAGTLYGRIGPAGCFAVNSAGFFFLTFVLAQISLPDRPVVAPPPIARALREGLGYARRHTVIGPALLLASVISVFGFPYIILLPALARDTLGLDASGLGYLMAAVGSGAVVGGLGLSAAGDLPRKGLLAAGSAILFGAALGTFAVVRSVRGTACLFFVMGVLQTVCVASINTTIQLAVEDGMRGRIMSMMTVILFGFATTGGLLVGLVGDHIGVPSALAAGGVIITIAAIALFVRAPALVRALPRTAEA